MPTVLQRASLAVKAAVGVFSGTSQQESGGITGIIRQSGVTAPRRGTQQFLEAYSTMPWLRAVTSLIAWSVASTEWQLFARTRDGRARRDITTRSLQKASRPERTTLLRQLKQAGELREIETHPFLDALDKGNSLHTGVAMRKVTQLHLDLAGEAFWFKQRNGVGAPVAFWPTPPHWVQETPSPDHRFFELSWSTMQRVVPDTEIFWMMELDPLNPYARGSGVVRALADELDTDEYTAKMAKQFFFNRAIPEILVMPEGDVSWTPTDTQRLEQQWTQKTQGFWRFAKPFFSTKKIGIHEFTQNFRNLQLTQLRQFERDTIIQVLGIPPEVLGVIENSNRATIETAQFLYTTNVLVPRLEFLRSHFQERLIPEYDARLIVDYVSPVPEDKEHRLNVMRAAPQNWSVNEWRAVAGDEPLEDKDHLAWVSTTLTPVDLDEDFMEEEEDVSPAPPTVATSTETPEPARAAKSPLRPADRLGDLPDLTRDTTRLLSDFWHAYGDVIDGLKRDADLDALERAVAENDLTAAVDAFHVLSLPQRFGEVRRAYMQAYELGTLEGADKALDMREAQKARRSRQRLEREFAEQFRRTNPFAQAAAETSAAQLVVDVTAQTEAVIRLEIGRAFGQQQTVQQTARRIRDHIGLIDSSRTGRRASRWDVSKVDAFRQRLVEQGVSAADVERRAAKFARALVLDRAKNIARTEIIQASVRGQQDLWVQATNDGLLDQNQMVRQWIVTDDDRLDILICEPLEDATAPLKGGTFTRTDGTETSYTGPPTHPGCRCGVGLIFKSELGREGR